MASLQSSWFPISSPAFSFVSVLNSGHSDRCTVYYCFSLYFPMACVRQNVFLFFLFLSVSLFSFSPSVPSFPFFFVSLCCSRLALNPGFKSSSADCSSKPGLANCWWDPISKKPSQKLASRCRLWVQAQYCKKTNKQTNKQANKKSPSSSAGTTGGNTVSGWSVFSFFFGGRYWGLNSGPTPWTTTPALFLWWVFLR
jgi:hypothetical protein